MSIVYQERESKSLEFKSKLPHFSQLIKTCVAFSNGTGGRLIIGVEDQTRKLIGVDEETRDRIYEEFPNSLYDATSPSLLVEIYEKNFEGVSLMIIEVPSSIRKPVCVKSEGIPKGVYLRAGPNTRKATVETIEELMRENKRQSFDEEILQADVNILSQELLRHMFGKVSLPRLFSEKVVMQSGATVKKYYPTVAGVLAFCENPHEYISEAFIHCTRFRGIDGRDIIQTEEIQGCLEKQMTDSFRLIRSWLKRDYHLMGVTLKSTLLVPEVALREAIANALLHRKYSTPGSIKIALYDNRLEIFSPGHFPGLVDVDNLGDGTTYLRNPHLARLARRLGLVEKLGTGIRLILESCKKARLKKPEFIEGADSVKVIFHFLPDNDNASSEEDRLLALFHMRAEVGLDDIQSYLQVSRNTATRRLNKLIKLGSIKRMGKGPAVKYVRTS